MPGEGAEGDELCEKKDIKARKKSKSGKTRADCEKAF